MMLVIYGPTVTGKTDLAIKLAKKYDGEIISADSRQVYKGLDIGTGKVSFKSKVEKYEGYWIVDDVKIHGFDLANPGTQYSVAEFMKFVSTTMIRIIEVGKLPIIAGGAGFYIKALLDGIETIGVPASRKLRRKLEKLSSKELYQKLLKTNPDRAQKMNESDRQNPRRLVRAIEIAMYNRYQVSSIKYQINPKYKIPNTKYLLVGLIAPNKYLYDRADRWLRERLDHGLADEVRNLIANKVSPKWLDDLGLEYRWMIRYLRGEISLNYAKKRLIGDIHNLIRRQKTFFRQFQGIKKFDISGKNWQKEIEKTVYTWYNQQDGRGKSPA